MCEALRRAAGELADVPGLEVASPRDLAGGRRDSSLRGGRRKERAGGEDGDGDESHEGGRLDCAVVDPGPNASLMGAATCRAVTSHGRQCRYAGMFGAANVGVTDDQRAKNLAPTRAITATAGTTTSSAWSESEIEGPLHSAAPRPGQSWRRTLPYHGPTIATAGPGGASACAASIGRLWPAHEDLPRLGSWLATGRSGRARRLLVGLTGSVLHRFLSAVDRGPRAVCMVDAMPDTEDTVRYVGVADCGAAMSGSSATAFAAPSTRAATS